MGTPSPGRRLRIRSMHTRLGLPPFHPVWMPGGGARQAPPLTEEQWAVKDCWRRPSDMWPLLQCSSERLHSCPCWQPQLNTVLGDRWKGLQGRRASGREQGGWRRVADVKMTLPKNSVYACVKLLKNKNFNFFLIKANQWVDITFWRI